MSRAGGPRLNRDEHEKAPAETYLTSPASFHAWLRRSGWRPKRPGPIIDPCACGWGGYSLGRQVGELLGIEYDLSDLHPRHPDVREANALTRSYRGGGAVLTNPAFSISSQLIKKALEEAGEIVLLLTTKSVGDGRTKHLARHDRFDHRLGFSLLPEHAERDPLAISRKDSITGLGLPNTGLSHGVFVWDRDHDSPEYVGVWIDRTMEDLAEVDRWRAIAAAYQPELIMSQGGLQMRLL